MRLTPLRRRLSPLAALGLLAVVACSGSAGAEPSPEQESSAAAVRTGGPPQQHARLATGPTATEPCGWRADPPTTYKHVVWIWFENHSYDQVVGHMPYLDDIADACGLATNYHSLTHPSLPNYIALTSGGFHGVHSDCEPRSCPVSSRSLFKVIQRAGLRWKGYAESMPSRCERVTQGSYAARHNPATYFDDIRRSCKRYDVPLRSDAHGLRHDLAAHRLPAFAYVTPNICNDMHDCGLSTGNRWISRWLQRILDSDAWANGRTAVFVTFDEGAGGGSCSAYPDSCHVATWVLGPSVVPGTRVDARFTHYSLLKTTTHMLGLERLLGHAADKSTRGMRGPFGM